MIRFGRDICTDLVQAERREWWLSNGLGAYAAGTIAGSLTRRYHGLLIAPVKSVLDRHLLMTKAEVTLELDGEQWPLYTNRWQTGVTEPSGQLHIESFYLDGRLPVWIYSLRGIRIEKRIFMETGTHVSWVVFRLLTPHLKAAVKLNIRLLANFRDHHGQMMSGVFQPLINAITDNHLSLDYAADTSLHIQVQEGRIESANRWVNNFLLEKESERGLPELDNHLEIGSAEIVLNPFGWQGLRMSLQASKQLNPLAALKLERARQTHFLAVAQQQLNLSGPAWIQQLMLSAQTFIFKRPLAKDQCGQSIIAGYPWFGDWGRDTMISLPGLTLATGQFTTALQILETFAQYVNKGMLPNRFPETHAREQEQPEYNTVDAALWYILAWNAYLDATEDTAALKKVMPILQEIIDAYLRGTRYKIHMDESDALIYAGQEGTQLTWMDAKIGNWVATPRMGKPVEVNALWYNALMALQGFCRRLNEDDSKYVDLSARVRKGFQRYINPDGGLYDVLDTQDGDDASIRPNQIFALSLPWALVDKQQAQSILEIVQKHLYTSYGLRSLSPEDRKYCPSYLGGVTKRDSAYHQGTVWAWLLGHFAMADFRTFGDSKRALAILTPVQDHLKDAGLGSISEIFDAEAPHSPRGAPVQAWSVATILEAWWFIKKNDNIRGAE